MLDSAVNILSYLSQGLGTTVSLFLAATVLAFIIAFCGLVPNC